MTQKVCSGMAPLAVDLGKVNGWSTSRSSRLTATKTLRVTDWMGGWVQLRSRQSCGEGNIRCYRGSNSDFQNFLWISFASIYLPTKNAQRHAVLSWYMYSGAPPYFNNCYVCKVMRILIVVRHNKPRYCWYLVADTEGGMQAEGV
jgi:hypothetical protein